MCFLWNLSELFHHHYHNGIMCVKMANLHQNASDVSNTKCDSCKIFYSDHLKLYIYPIRITSSHGIRTRMICELLSEVVFFLKTLPSVTLFLFTTYLFIGLLNDFIAIIRSRKRVR